MASRTFGIRLHRNDPILGGIIRSVQRSGKFYHYNKLYKLAGAKKDGLYVDLSALPL